MSECLKCQATIPPHSKVCPKCGAPANIHAAANPAPLDDEDTVHFLLLNAHLLQIRGDLEGARSECIKALRTNPDSIEAHTLLGDICKSEGKIEEAANWYKLALDLNPDNRTNLQKLEQLAARKAASAPILSNETEKAAPSDDSSPKKTSTFTIQTALTILVCALTLALIVILLRTPQRNQLPNAVIQPNAHTEVAPGTLITQGAKSNGNIQIVEQPQNLQQPISREENPDLARIKELNSRPVISSNKLQITGTQYDPRAEYEFVTFSSPTTESGLTQNTLLHQSLLIAREVFDQKPSLSKITVKALYRMSGNDGVLLTTVFIGDLTREKAMQINPETTAVPEQLAAFDNPWWHQEVKQN